jgi:diguanylate cyclase (GGDEF)-like protein
MYSAQDPHFSRITQAFSDKALESAFQNVFFDKTLFQARLSLVFAAFLYGMFGILDCLVIPDIKHFAWFIRFFIVCPLLLAICALTYAKYYRKIMRFLLFLAGFASGAGIVAMIVKAPSPGNHLYYSGVLLCVLFYFVLIPDFIVATILSWIIFVLYLVMVIFVSDISLPALMNNSSLFLAFNFTGMLARCSFERHIRSDFLQRRIIETQTEELRMALLDVEEARCKAEGLSRMDPLTNLYNRRHFLLLAEQEFERNKRNHHCTSIALLDLDHFKRINDTHGHYVGDLVLKEVASKIRSTIRRPDTPCRYGGEEFAILLPETDFIDAELIGWRLQKVIEETVIISEKGLFSVTISIGIATLPEGDLTELDVLIDRADQALYDAKRSGRNQVKFWIPPAIDTYAQENMSFPF